MRLFGSKKVFFLRTFSKKMMMTSALLYLTFSVCVNLQKKKNHNFMSLVLAERNKFQNFRDPIFLTKNISKRQKNIVVLFCFMKLQPCIPKKFPKFVNI